MPMEPTLLPPLPTKPVDYPYGLCVETEAGWFLIRDKVRFRIPTERVFDSWRFTAVLTTEAAVKHFTIAGKLGFRDGTVIQNIADGRFYLVSKNKRRLITSPDVWAKYGLDPADVLVVSAKEANLHEDGEALE